MSGTTSIEYRPVFGFDGYRVGDDGSVWSRWAHNGHQARRLGETWRRLRAQPDGDGYLALNLFRGGIAHRRKIHLLVLEAFVGPRPSGMEGCHNNGIVSDCALSNLRWDTKSANQCDRRRHGTDPRGERSGNAKLTRVQVAEIRERIRRGELLREIASAFKIAPSTVSAIKSGKLWGWIASDGASHVR